MKLICRTLGLILLIAIIAVIGYSWSQRIPWAEQELSKRLEMNVHLDDISITPFSLTVKGIDIKDPKDGSEYKSDRLYVRFSPFIPFQSPTTIKEIELDGTYFDIHSTKIDTSSWKSMVQKGMDLFSKFKDTVKDTVSKKKSDPEEKKQLAFIIQKLTIDGLKIKVQDPIRDQKAYETPNIPKLTIENIESESADNLKMSFDVTIEKILQKAMKR